MSVEELIQQACFVHDDPRTYAEFVAGLDAWRHANEATKATVQVVTSFQTLGKRLGEATCPGLHTQGWKQAIKAVSVLEEFASLQIVNGTAAPGHFQEALYQVFLHWFTTGPASVHLAIVTALLKSRHLAMTEFTTTLKGERLLKLLRAVTSPVEKKEDTPNKQFYETYRTYLDVFFKTAFEESQLVVEDTVKVTLDFVFHLYVDYTHLDDHSANQMAKQAKAILHIVKTPWKDFSDIPRLKSYIQKFSSLALGPSFPRNKAVADLFYESFTLITKQIQKPGQTEIFCDDIFDLLGVLSRCQGPVEYVVRAFTAAVVFLDQKNNVKNQPVVFKAVTPRFKALVEIIDPVFLQDTRFISDAMTMLESSYANNGQLTDQWLDLSLPLLRRQTLKTLNACRNVLSKYDKIKWKEHESFANSILDAIQGLEVPQGHDGSKDARLKEITTIVSYVLRGIKKARILKSFGEKLMSLSIHLLELKEDGLYDAAEDVAEHIDINVKENKEAVMGVMRRLHTILQDDSLSWSTCWDLNRAISDMVKSIFEPVKDGTIFSDEDFHLMTSLCLTCLEKDAFNPENGSLSTHFSIALSFQSFLLEWLSQAKKMSLAKEIIPLVMKKLKEDEEGEDIIITCLGSILVNFSSKGASILAAHLDDLIAVYIEKGHSMLLNPIYQMYSTHPVTIDKKEHFQKLFTQMLTTCDTQAKTMLPILFWSAAKKQAEFFTEANLKDMIAMAKSDRSFQVMAIQVLQDVCRRKPGKVLAHLEPLLVRDGWDPQYSALINDILSTLALYEESVSPKVVDYMINSVKRNTDKSVLLTAMNAIRIIGFKYPDVIKPKRPKIQDLAIMDVDAQGQKQIILDMIDGKTSEDMKKQLAAQQDAMGGLMEKVDDVGEAVASAVDELENQKQDLNNVRNEVTKQTQRIDEVEETVEDTLVKVQEIDNKTLSHAPYWSRDISKLLNPATDHDWRLLSTRLGYSNADIRGWAQQADPCMAMLNEWYATRKTSEASFAILTNLQEMNRMDAALIVENAMKKAEAVVEDEEFDYASPPEIFLSYQWGHQEEVKLLQRHLAMAGYDCWMDIGQMGGGDKLFEKIDNGMRAAKLVISCVTAKYAKSPNCNREINLAVGVNKPVIPLLLESCAWPPPGSMGPIFSESLYIKFFQSGADNNTQQTNDDRFWPEEKFQELLMQLSVNGLVPDEGKIEPMYRDWWMPLEPEIKIDKSKTRDGGQNTDSNQTEVAVESGESPDVFISYQWGKQKNIILLYQRLTALGFSCWLDIKQMGGGDSLYDKIDKGVRHCKVVLSCVTQKYSLSANCRREVSLADALKKPLLPLLLEDMTWPPSGPMSMVMTQLLYIPFHKESVQSNWEGPSFEELVEKIKMHLNRGLKPNDTAQVEQTSEIAVGKQEVPDKEQTKVEEDDSNNIQLPDKIKAEDKLDASAVNPNENSESPMETKSPDEGRPRSAVPGVPGRTSGTSRDWVLPPPHQRLQTSRSCSIL